MHVDEPTQSLHGTPVPLKAVLGIQLVAALRALVARRGRLLLPAQTEEGWREGGGRRVSSRDEESGVWCILTSPRSSCVGRQAEPSLLLSFSTPPY